MKNKVTCILLCFVIIMITLCKTNEAYASNTYDKVVVGDSRIVGLASCDGVKVKERSVNGTNKEGNIYYYAKVGIGYNWLKENINKIAKKCDKDTKVYIALGVNDLGNISKYKNLYMTLSEKCNGAKIYIVKVGPVNEQEEARYGYTIKQSKVNDFNSTLNKNKTGYVIVDFWPRNAGSNTSDGIHYKTCVYKDVLKKLNRNNILR